jgi:hypothetical protein
MKVILAIYNFLVGDIVILVGVVITLIILALINTVGPLEAIRGVSGYILIVAILIILGASLRREVRER